MFITKTLLGTGRNLSNIFLLSVDGFAGVVIFGWVSAMSYWFEPLSSPASRLGALQSRSYVPSKGVQ